MKYFVRSQNYYYKMNITNLKENYLKKSIQCIQMDSKGKVFFSSNNILKINNGYGLKNNCPIIESIILMLDDLETETIFSCIEIIHDNKRILTDITVIKEGSQVFFGNL